MTDLPGREYSGLRDSIGSRGTARPLACLAGLSAWAGTVVAVLIWLPNPIAAVVPLVVLVATFEVIRSLHLGVERIGRYLQVFFEEAAEAEGAPFMPPAWERSAMVFGPSIPGAGVHPLFVPIFFIATIANLIAVVLPGPMAVEIGTMAVPHAAFLFWLIYCDRGMRRQRAAELARFRALRADAPPAPR